MLLITSIGTQILLVTTQFLYRRRPESISCIPRNWKFSVVFKLGRKSRHVWMQMIHYNIMCLIHRHLKSPQKHVQLRSSWLRQISETYCTQRRDLLPKNELHSHHIFIFQSQVHRGSTNFMSWHNAYKFRYSQTLPPITSLKYFRRRTPWTGIVWNKPIFMDAISYRCIAVTIRCVFRELWIHITFYDIRKTKPAKVWNSRTI